VKFKVGKFEWAKLEGLSMDQAMVGKVEYGGITWVAKVWLEKYRVG